MLELQGVLVISFREACSVNLCLVCILYFAWHKVHLRIQFWLWDCCQLLPLWCVSTLPLHCASVACRNYLSHLNCGVMTCRTLEANADYLRRLYKIGFRLQKTKQNAQSSSYYCQHLAFFFFQIKWSKTTNVRWSTNNNTRCSHTLTDIREGEKAGKSHSFPSGVLGCCSCVIQSQSIRPIDIAMRNKMADGAML